MRVDAVGHPEGKCSGTPWQWDTLRVGAVEHPEAKRQWDTLGGQS